MPSPWSEERVKYVAHRLSRVYGAVALDDFSSYLSGWPARLEIYVHELAHLLALGWGIRDIQHACKLEPLDDVVAQHCKVMHMQRSRMGRSHPADQNEILTVEISCRALTIALSDLDRESAYSWAAGQMTRYWSNPKNREAWVKKNEHMVRHGTRQLKNHLRRISDGFDIAYNIRK